jgi:Ras-related protein Rab-18
MLRFTDDKFDKSEQPTIGVDFKVKHLEIDGQKIYLQVTTIIISDVFAMHSC